MTSTTPPATSSPDETAVRALYHQLLAAWSARSGAAFAELFTANGRVVGFDGSEMLGPDEISRTLSAIFADHPTGAYVGKVRAVQFLAPTVAALSAVAGVIPAGQSQLNPALNSVQTLIAVHTTSAWRIALYHNTPAAYDGRPEAVEGLRRELEEVREAG